jgi:hypothetical protein
MQQVQNTLTALQNAASAVTMAAQYEHNEEAVNDTAQAIVELLHELNNNNFDIADLAQQALEA